MQACCVRLLEFTTDQSHANEKNTNSNIYSVSTPIHFQNEHFQDETKQVIVSILANYNLTNVDHL
jgi:hypothetical protein